MDSRARVLKTSPSLHHGSETWPRRDKRKTSTPRQRCAGRGWTRTRVGKGHVAESLLCTCATEGDALIGLLDWRHAPHREKSRTERSLSRHKSPDAEALVSPLVARCTRFSTSVHASSRLASYKSQPVGSALVCSNEDPHVPGLRATGGGTEGENLSLLHIYSK